MANMSYAQTSSVGLFSGLDAAPWQKERRNFLPRIGLDFNHRNQGSFRPGLSIYLSKIALGKPLAIPNHSSKIEIDFSSVLAHLYADIILSEKEKFIYGLSTGIGLAYLVSNEVSLLHTDGSISYSSFDKFDQNRYWTSFITCAGFTDVVVSERWRLHIKLGLQQFITPGKMNGKLVYGQNTVFVYEQMNPLRLFFQAGMMYRL